MSEWRGVKWEYRSEHVSWLDLHNWSDVGKYGWELVSVDKEVAYFKRPVYDSIMEDFEVLSRMASEKRPMGG